MSKKAYWLQALVFLAFIGAFFVLNIIIPDRETSEQENRSLQTAPSFSLSSLFGGSYTKQYEDYVTDQFAFRDGWVTLKARAELLSGKLNNKGIYLCEGERLIEGFESPDWDEVAAKLDAVNALAENTDAELYFALIPSSAELYSELLPYGAPNDSQTELIARAYDYVNAEGIDIASELERHSDEDILYRTDHHWTTLGAYYGSCAILDAMGLQPAALESYSPVTVTDSFYGTTWSSSGFSWVSPDSITRYVEPGGETITNYPQGEAEAGVLYDESYLEVKDKYSYFFGGNTPLLEIDTGNDGPSLLIIRDSYSDSLCPFLFGSFSHISMIDLRYYKTPLSAYIAQNDFDAVLVCYSVSNLTTDLNVALMGL